MRRTGRTLSLKGRVNMVNDKNVLYDTYTQIWADERPGFIWKVTDLIIAPFSPTDFYRFDGLDVWTMPEDQLVGTDPFALGLEDNRCFAIYQLGGQSFPPGGGVVRWQGIQNRELLDPDNFITRELGIRSTNTAKFSYLFVLEEYDTTPVEEVLQLLKQSAQKAGIINDSPS